MNKKTKCLPGKNNWPIWSAALALAIGSTLVPAKTTESANITVDINGNCALEDAINSANANLASNGCIAGDFIISDTITLETNVISTAPVYGTPPDTSTPPPVIAAFPVITSDITIEGGGHTIDGMGTGPVLLNEGYLTINQAIITGGNNQSINKGGGGIANSNSGTLTLTNSTIQNNHVTNNSLGGGGIYNTGILSLENCTITGNSGDSGGGIYHGGNATASIDKSTVSGNTSLWSGGGIFSNASLLVNDSSITGNTVTSGDGGGIASRGDLTVDSSTINNNEANDSLGYPSGGTGAGVSCSDIMPSANNVITNSTISGNTAKMSGGGIRTHSWYGGSPSVQLINSTITGNSVTDPASSIGGGISVHNYGTVSLKRSIVSGNSTARNVGAETYDAPNATILADAHNVFGHNGLTDGEAFSGQFIPLTPPNSSDLCATNGGGLNPAPSISEIIDPVLKNNGGSTQTHALVSGSIAIDLAPDCGTPPVTSDQRGYPRPIGQGCDSGAYEYTPSTNNSFLSAVNFLLLSKPPTTN